MTSQLCGPNRAHCLSRSPALLLTGGTVLAAEVALQRGLACSTAGGTHHAFPTFGSGFCLLNDLAVAAKYLMGSSPSKRKVLIVDLDVHQVGIPHLYHFNSVASEQCHKNKFSSRFSHSQCPFFVFAFNRVMAQRSSLKTNHVCLHSPCIVGKTSPSVNNRVT